MNARRTSFAARLRAEAQTGRSVEVLRADWQSLADELDDDADALEAAFHEAAGPLAPTGAAVAVAQALAIGVVGAHGETLAGDAAFTGWFGGEHGRASLEPLLARARREGAGVGLVETDDGDVLATWAGSGAAAGRWPLSAAARQALARGREAQAVVVFAPSRSDELAARAAQAFNLTAAEARLAQAMLFAPSLEIAASQIGVGRETARDALRRIMAKAGVRRIPALLARLTELMCASPQTDEIDERVLVSVFGVTPSEARCAAAVATGQTARQAAQGLGLSQETVKSYIKSVLAKTGVRRAKDLGRLLVEARELSLLASVVDPVFETAREAGRLRIIPADEGRQIAFLDYGPRSGRPALIFHGYAAGRSLPPGYVRALHAAGLRPIVPQRPGFGLTTPASEDYLDCAADDLARLVAALGLRDPVVLARDGGIAVALEFAVRHPGVIERFVLLNPRTPMRHTPKRPGLIDLVTRRLLGNPKLVWPVAEMLRRNGVSSAVEANLRQTCAHAAADRAVLEDRAVVDGLVRDIQALIARSAWGFAAEHAIFAEGWEPPKVTSGTWTVVFPGELMPDTDAPWQGLPDVRFRIIDGGGYLMGFSHPEALAAVLVEA